MQKKTKKGTRQVARGKMLREICLSGLISQGSQIKYKDSRVRKKEYST